MADRVFNDLRVLGRERVLVHGSFAPNGSSALDQTKVKGRGFTVAYTSTGLYTVTLKDKYPDLVAWELGLMFASATDGKLQLGAVDLVTNLTIQIRNVAVGTATDIAANSGNRVSFAFLFQNHPVGG